MTWRIAVASKNPVKLEAARAGCARVLNSEDLEMIAIEAPADLGIPAQPMSDRETRRGAMLRARAAEEAQPEAHFWLGLEGGVDDDGDELWAFAWIAARWPGGHGESRTASFALPKPVADLVRQGIELGEADDRVFGSSNSKQKSGAVGLLTQNRLDRAALYEDAVVLAFIPYLHHESS